MSSYYEILEVPSSASASEIRSAHLRLAREYHPDRVPEHLTKLRADAEEKTKQINEAWAILSDPAKRRKYDLRLRTEPAGGGYRPPASYSTSVANSPREKLDDWVRGHKKVARWLMVVGGMTLVLVVIGAVIAFRSARLQPANDQDNADATEIEIPQRTISFQVEPVQFHASPTAGGGVFTIQLVSAALSKSKTVLSFHVVASGMAVSCSTSLLAVLRELVMFWASRWLWTTDLTEPYLLDDRGRKYYSTSGLVGGDQANFDVYNFTRRINVAAHQGVLLSVEFPAIEEKVSPVTFVSPGLGKWQAEWRWSGIDLVGK